MIMASILRRYPYGFTHIMLIYLCIGSASTQNGLCTAWNETEKSVAINMDTTFMAGTETTCTCAISIDNGGRLLIIFESLRSTTCGTSLRFTDNTVAARCENGSFLPVSFEKPYTQDDTMFLLVTSNKNPDEIMSGTLQIKNMQLGGTIFIDCLYTEVEKPQEENYVNVGLIVGCIIAALVLIVIIILVIICWRQYACQFQIHSNESEKGEHERNEEIEGPLQMDNFYFNSSDEMNGEVEKHRVVSPDGNMYTLVHKTQGSEFVSSGIIKPDHHEEQEEEEDRKDRYLF